MQGSEGVAHEFVGDHRRLNRTVCVAVAVAAMIGGTAAQPASAQQAPSSSASANDELQEIVVTAGRRAELLSNVGVAITAVTGPELENLSASSLEDYMSRVPGLSFQSYGTPGYGVIEIRGISPQSSGTTVATYVDDVPFGGSGAVSQNAWFSPDIDPADLERVEVLKGPQGTLYGSSSLGGVIKYVTKTPSLTTTEVSTTEELNDTNGGVAGTKVRASASTPIVENQMAIRVSGYYEYDGGYIDDIQLGGSDVNRAERSGVRATLFYEPIDDLKIRLSASVQNSHANGYDITDDAGLNFQPLYGYYQQKRYTPEGYRRHMELDSAEISWDTDIGSLISATSYSRYDSRATNDLTMDAPYYPGLISTTNPAGGVGQYGDEQKTEELRFNSKKLANLVEFVSGVFYQHASAGALTGYYNYDTTGQAIPADFLGGGANTGTLDEYAAFGDVTVYVLPQLDITGGYRWSDIQQTQYTDIAGLLYGYPGTVDIYPVIHFGQVNKTYLGGIRWHITDEVMVYGRAATGYRPGGTRAVLPDAPPGFGDTYNSDAIHSYEAGVKVRALGGRLTLSTDVYQINWTNIQTIVYIGVFNTNGNAGTAKSKGAEFEMSYIPLDGVTVGANSAYTDARFTATSALANVTAGERLYFVPTWTRTLYVDYNLPFLSAAKPQIGADYIFRSSQNDDTGITLPGYNTFNAHAAVQFNNQSLRLYVKNLTGEHGITGSGGYIPGLPYEIDYLQPRTFGLIYSQKF
jgi:iron complex outermembrane recepter protein